jgi:regulatory protein
MPDSDELKKARSKAFRYLSYRDRSSREMVEYLNQKGYSRSIVRKTLDRLTELGYIDDERFGVSWGQSRVSSKKFGPRRLKQELLAKGLSDEIVDRTLATLYAEVDEEELARRCAEKKVSSLRGLDVDVQRRRLAQFLQRKGYPATIVYKILDEMIPRFHQTTTGIDT